ncbi:MAG: CvpA family protein [candidate division WOR-3 bacterium]
MTGILDIVALAFIGFSAFQGFRSKAGSQFWALVALIVAVIGASILTPSFSNSLEFFSDPKIRSMVAFVIIFIIIHQGIQFLAQILKLNFSFGTLDPVGGLIFALIESSLFVGIIGLALMSIPQFRFPVENSLIVYKLAQISKGIILLFGGRGLF